MRAQGEAGLAEIVQAPAHALVAVDFDGTLAPIAGDPMAVRPQAGAVAALTDLAARVGTVAIITGRPAADAVDLGGLAAVPGLIVLGHYGGERWQGGELTSAPPPPGIEIVRRELPGLLAAGPAGASIEDKGTALAVHTRRATDPAGALRELQAPLADLAARTGLALEPGRLVLELRPQGTDKGTALDRLAAERAARSVLFCGDDLGDLAAFEAVGRLRERGIGGCTVASASSETPQVAAAADVVVDGPRGVVEFLAGLAAKIAGNQPSASS